MKLLYFLFLTLFVSIVSCNQNKLQNETAAITNKVIELQEKAETFASDSTSFFLNEARNLLANTRSLPDYLRAENEFLLGRYFEQRNQRDSAVIHYHNAIQLVNDSIRSSREVVYFRRAWGLYLQLEDYGNGLNVSNRFISLLDSTDFEHLALAYNFSENAYTSLGNFNKALTFNQLGVAAYLKINDTSNFARKKADQAYLRYIYLGQKERAISILDSLVQDEEHYSTNVRIQLYKKYGTLSFFENSYEQALEYYLKGLTELKNLKGLPDIDRNQRMGSQYANITEAYVELKKYDLAGKYADSVFRLGVENVRPTTYQSTLQYRLKLDYMTKSGLDSLMRSLDEVRSFQSKIHQQKIENELLELAEANEREKQFLINRQQLELNNLKLKQNQSRMWVLLAMLLLLIIIGVLIYKQRKIGAEKERLLGQQRLLRSQMNPHFTLNTLTAIQFLMKEDSERATTYLVKFSRLLGLIFENSKHNYVPLEDELESLKNYLELQSIRFPSRFSFNFEIKNNEKLDIFIPPMLIQPFVENSIDHGFTDTNREGRIDISIEVKSGFVFCVIEDNGKGLVKIADEQREGSTALIAKFLKRTTGMEIEYVNKTEIMKDDTGLIVKLHIPFKNNNG